MYNCSIFQQLFKFIPDIVSTKWSKRSPADATGKSPDQKFWMDCKKDKIGNFERGCSQSNHRKVTDLGLLQDFKRMIMTFGSRVVRAEMPSDGRKTVETGIMIEPPAPSINNRTDMIAGQSRGSSATSRRKR